MSVSYETRKGTCIFHRPVSALYHSESGCLSEHVCERKRGALDVCVFVCE